MRALIAMSGGVDSSVAARLMLEAGWDCLGCTMKLFYNEDAGVAPDRSCCSLDDVEDAKSVAFRLGIPHYTFNFSEDFRAQVMDKFARCYLSGRTPNPCMDCNQFLKFGKLLARARVLGCDCVVTGHYARIHETASGFRLEKGLDPQKDQSYFLYMLTQDQLAHVRFPLGELTKEEARTLAEQWGFRNAHKPDSQDICFVPDGDYAAAIRTITGKEPTPGDFVDKQGKVLGKHKGLICYTVGQHRGLGIDLPGKRYVTALDPITNTVTLGELEDLFTREAALEAVTWCAGTAPMEPVSCRVKIRYRHREQPATVYPGPGDTARVVFEDPQRAVTPGQAAVFYDGDTVLGGGTICRAL